MCRLPRPHAGDRRGHRLALPHTGAPQDTAPPPPLPRLPGASSAVPPTPQGPLHNSSSGPGYLSPPQTAPAAPVYCTEYPTYQSTTDFPSAVQHNGGVSCNVAWGQPLQHSRPRVVVEPSEPRTEERGRRPSTRTLLKGTGTQPPPAHCMALSNSELTATKVAGSRRGWRQVCGGMPDHVSPLQTKTPRGRSSICE